MSLSINGLADTIISPAKIMTLVVPSPTSSSWALEISNMDFAAGWVTFEIIIQNKINFERSKRLELLEIDKNLDFSENGVSVIGKDDSSHGVE